MGRGGGGGGGGGVGHFLQGVLLSSRLGVCFVKEGGVWNGLGEDKKG